MQLVGMLDSPYVRRVAVSLQLLGLPFEHRSVSVFSTFPQFQAINPVVKAPTLVCDDGEVLMESTLILDYAVALAVVADERGRLDHRVDGLELRKRAEDRDRTVLERQAQQLQRDRHAPHIGRILSLIHI